MFPTESMTRLTNIIANIQFLHCLKLLFHRLEYSKQPFSIHIGLFKRIELLLNMMAKAEIHVQSKLVISNSKGPINV